MGYGRRRRKAPVGKLILFLVLAIIFGTGTGFLAYQLPEQISALNETKETLATLKQSSVTMKADVENYQKQIEEMSVSVKEVETKLAEAKAQNPEVVVNGVEGGKYAYLTFDDGPSDNTIKILDFLKANNLQATFFVLGKQNQDEVYKRIVEEGHTLAVHTNTHDYSEIYKNVDSFMADMNTLSAQLEAITGVKPTISRFPGGSNNTISSRYGGKEIMSQIIPAVEAAGFTYFDWNVDSMDASKNKQDKDVIVSSVLNGAKNKKEAVILMHDAAPKATTVEALPEIVEGLRKQGFTFRAITDDTPQVKF